MTISDFAYKHKHCGWFVEHATISSLIFNDFSERHYAERRYDERRYAEGCSTLTDGVRLFAKQKMRNKTAIFCAHKSIQAVSEKFSTHKVSKN
jgi:hypothetical protein